ncbi:hypothetical protein BGZ83_011104 [Gryganskiella cystojenkinii]|nr:hypothetical protein BGZ83_011104 [Gryganskiella cystojenkinii]
MKPEKSDYEKQRDKNIEDNGNMLASLLQMVAGKEGQEGTKNSNSDEEMKEATFTAAEVDARQEQEGAENAEYYTEDEQNCTEDEEYYTADEEESKQNTRVYRPQGRQQPFETRPYMFAGIFIPEPAGTKRTTADPSEAKQIPAARRSSRSATIQSYNQKRQSESMEEDSDGDYEKKKKKGQRSNTRSIVVGYRVKNGRVYGTADGSSCHQCRQRTTDEKASCTNCVLKYDIGCLVKKRYSDTREQAKAPNWICPSCRGICNCSQCRKTKGLPPTGILVPKAMALGMSVSEYLGDQKRISGAAQEEHKDNV